MILLPAARDPSLFDRASGLRSRPAFSRALPHRSPILQHTEQRADIPLRYVIASHQKSHRDIAKKLVESWLGATFVTHDFLPPR
jgi:hypothetical protein